MKYTITHDTTYHYGCPVLLEPHVFRLRPRSDGYQRLGQYDLSITPTPEGMTHLLDAEGNTTTRCWWSPIPAEQLTIMVRSEVETFCTRPFEYLLEGWATQLPLDYPMTLLGHLQPYLSATGGILGVDPKANYLAQEIAHQVQWNPVNFLGALNQRIYKKLTYQVREEGFPLPPSLTWAQQSGTCRDFVLLFMAVCRAVGLAARFVSGYEEGDPDHEQMLHAWVEVYLPGAGWRGYDPTHGLVVSDRHVAIAASGWPQYAAPVTGAHRGGNGTSVQLSNKISIFKIVP
jgi:transglutaminase-like putative cysteine protease